MYWLLPANHTDFWFIITARADWLHDIREAGKRFVELADTEYGLKRTTYNLDMLAHRNMVRYFSNAAGLDQFYDQAEDESNVVLLPPVIDPDVSPLRDSQLFATTPEVHFSQPRQPVFSFSMVVDQFVASSRLVRLALLDNPTAAMMDA